MDCDSSDPLDALRLEAARFALGLCNSWELPSVADRALTAGIYSDALAELAAVDEPIMSDVGPLFERALRELGVPISSHRDSAWVFTRFCMEQIVNTTASPVEQLGLVWGICAELSKRDSAFGQRRYFGEELDVCLLMGIYDSYSEPNETFYEPEQGHIHNETERRLLLDRHAREEARAWLERHPS